MFTDNLISKDYVFPKYNPNDKEFFFTNVSVNIDTFEKIYSGYHCGTNKFQDNFSFDICKHDNFAEYYIVRKILGYDDKDPSNINFNVIKHMSSDEFAKKYADWYINFFMSLSTDSVKTNKFVGIFYGLEYSYGIEIYKKLLEELNKKKKEKEKENFYSTIEDSRLNYEKGINLLISNSILTMDINSYEIEGLKNLADSLRMYWILWQKSPSSYEFFVNIEQN